MRNSTGNRASVQALVLGLAAATACVTAPSAAMAQDGDAAASADTRSVVGSDIIVTARRRAETAQSVPLTIAAQTGEMLEAKAITSVADLAAITPSLQITNSGVNPGSGFIYLRGFGSVEDIIGADQPVAVYIDNVFNEGATGITGTKLYDVERVEVLKGPQGTLFGRNSTGGAVQIFTKAPSDTLEGEVLGGIGNYDSARAAGFVNLPIGDKAALRLTGEYNKDGGWSRSTFTGLGNGQRTTYMARASLRLEPTDRLKILLRAGFNRLEANGLPGGMLFVINGSNPAVQTVALELQGKTLAQGGLLNATTIAAGIAALNAEVANNRANRNVNSSTINYDKSNNYRASAEIEYELSDAVSIKSITGYRRLTSRSASDNDGTRFYIINNFRRREMREFSQELQLVTDMFDGRLSNITGFYYYDVNGTDDQRNANLYFLLGKGGNTGINTVKRRTPAVFSQATFKITPTLNLTGGLRYTWNRQKMIQQGTQYGSVAFGATPPTDFSDLILSNPVSCAVPDTTVPCYFSQVYKDSALSWLVTADWKPVDGVMVFGKVTKGFKSGGNQFRVGPSPATAVPFRPEFVTEYEAGIKTELLDRKLLFNLSAYLDDFSNVQQFITSLDGNTIVSRVNNVAAAQIKGVEVEVEARPAPGLSVGGTLGYSEGKYKRFIISNFDVADAFRFPFLPKWSYTLYGSYEQPTSFGRVALSANWRWVDDTLTNGLGRKGPEDFPTNIPASVLTPGAPTETQTQRAYGILNGRVLFGIDTAGVEVSVWGKNILNKRYKGISNDLIAAGLGYVPVLWAAPRTYGLEVRKSF